MMNSTKTYSKKQSNNIVTNAIMKLILTNKVINKNSIKDLINIECNNKYLIDYVDKLNRSQIQSLTNFASKLIQKYKISNEAEIIINEYDYNTLLNDIDITSKSIENLNLENIKDKILILLMSFRRDNMNAKI